ncbi:MAG: isoprenylcysteine carboxylmethyltransferase family protein [Verrucomicrobiota bacterium]|jgi:protein-S-isoprenylcysteine O-methyltransferase Ste14
MHRGLSIIGYLAMAGGLLGLIYMRSVLSVSPVVIAVQLAAVALMVWARVTFGRRSFHAVANPTDGGLVTTGPYRHIRHPIYTAVCLFTVAAVAGNWSWHAAILGGVVLAGAGVRIFCEETLLVVRYPAYREYAAKTPRMIPFLF